MKFLSHSSLVLEIRLSSIIGTMQSRPSHLCCYMASYNLCLISVWVHRAHTKHTLAISVGIAHTLAISLGSCHSCVGVATVLLSCQRLPLNSGVVPPPDDRPTPRYWHTDTNIWELAPCMDIYRLSLYGYLEGPKIL